MGILPIIVSCAPPARTFGSSAPPARTFGCSALSVLASALIATAAKTMGTEVVKGLLSTITQEQVRRWRPLLEGLSLEAKLESFKDLYQREDPFIDVESANDEHRLIERNCPFLSTATEHPELCSISVSTLRNLLGFHVYREERFQSGHGRCVFRVDTTRPVVAERDVFEMEIVER